MLIDKLVTHYSVFFYCPDRKLFGVSAVITHSHFSYVLINTFHPSFICPTSDLYPSTFVLITFLHSCCSSLLIIWPKRHKRFPLDVSITDATFKLHILISYVIILVTPHIHLSILNSSACNHFSLFFLVAQYSTPYSTTGLINALNMWPFILSDFLGSHIAPGTILSILRWFAT